MKSVLASLSSAVLLQYNLPICLCEQLRLTLSQSCALITDSDMLVNPVQSEQLLQKSSNWRLFGEIQAHITHAGFFYDATEAYI